MPKKPGNRPTGPQHITHTAHRAAANDRYTLCVCVCVYLYICMYNIVAPDKQVNYNNQ